MFIHKSFFLTLETTHRTSFVAPSLSASHRRGWGVMSIQNGKSEMGHGQGSWFGFLTFPFLEWNHSGGRSGRWHGALRGLFGPASQLPAAGARMHDAPSRALHPSTNKKSR